MILSKPKNLAKGNTTAEAWQWDAKFPQCGKSDLYVNAPHLGLKDVRLLINWLTEAEAWLATQHKKDRRA